MPPGISSDVDVKLQAHKQGTSGPKFKRVADLNSEIPARLGEEVRAHKFWVS
jgi:hypothetical protein